VVKAREKHPDKARSHIAAHARTYGSQIRRLRVSGHRQVSPGAGFIGDPVEPLVGMSLLAPRSPAHQVNVGDVFIYVFFLTINVSAHLFNEFP
jgi:hypothetical protein